MFIYAGGVKHTFFHIQHYATFLHIQHYAWGREYAATEYNIYYIKYLYARGKFTCLIYGRVFSVNFHHAEITTFTVTKEGLITIFEMEGYTDK